MANEDDQVSLSPTVLLVIEQFAAAMRTDNGIEGSIIDRLEKLLRKGIVPKPHEIDTALFGPPSDSEK